MAGTYPIPLSELHYAASIGDEGKVRQLIAEGCNVNAFEDGFSALQLAADHGHLEVVRTLLDGGADVNAHEPAMIGNTPLGEIAGNCSLEMARLLVDAGADPTIRGWMQLCALDKAKVRKRGDGPAVYRLLLDAAKCSGR
jgi:ankyrin repeat protein